MRTSPAAFLLLLSLYLHGGQLAAAPRAAAAVAQPAAPPGTPAPERSAALRALLDEHVDQLMADNPVRASTKGDERFNDKLEDVSPEALAAQQARLRDRLDRVLALDLKALNEVDATDAALLRLELETALAAARFRPEQTPLDNLSGPQIDLPQIAGSLRFATARHYADYVARLEQLPRVLAQHEAHMRQGMKEGRIPPRVCVNRTGEQAAAQASAEIKRDPTLSPFYEPMAKLPPGDAAAQRARKAISQGVVPAYERLAAFLRDEYLPACRDSIAASDGVDGVARYEFALRRYTTTTLSAKEIHALGGREVARLRAEMMRVIERTDFPQQAAAAGEELFASFIQHLRTDPRFYFTNKAEQLRSYRDLTKRVDGELAALFRVLPRCPYGVRELPAFSAPSAPNAYYYPGNLRGGVAGSFMVNTYRLDQRPRYEMIALALHEAVPGHHLQIALADELEGMHPLHGLIDHTVFVEGWALYAERLGLEMAGGGIQRSTLAGEGCAFAGEPLGGQGLYTDPYDDFGRLTYEMWRACRLVVDTGIHSMGWSRQRAIDFMLANSALSPLNIEREVDRYIAWPGQACAYKIGELKIRELRSTAQQRLGEAFDLRAFHEVVLGSGAAPLNVVEARVSAWIDRASRSSDPARDGSQRP